MSSNTSDGEIVRITRKGQATIPKRFRDALGIDPPGRVRFRETEAGIVVEPVERPATFRGFASESTEASARELLDAAREREGERERRLREAAGETHSDE